MPKKYYAVKNGKCPGVYETWADCRAQTDGYSGAVFKSFPTRAEAVAFVRGETSEIHETAACVAYVDGSYNVRTKEYGYGAVVFSGGNVREFSGKGTDAELATMRNVAGEIKGAEFVMNLCRTEGIPAVDIYYDYQGIAEWAKGTWRTNKDGTRAYKALYDEVKKSVNVRFVKVKGHSGDIYNDRADRLAKDAVGNV